MKRIFLVIVWLFIPLLLSAQSTFIPLNKDYYHLIDRFQIKFQDKEHLLATSFKPLRRSDLATFLQHVNEQYESLSIQDQFNLRYLLNDNWAWTNSQFNENDKSWWNIAYDKKSDLLYYDSDNFTLRLNPVGYITAGNDSEADGTLLTNTRGVEAIGLIDKKIGFYTFLTTTQARFPAYVSNFVRTNLAFPNEGFWKENGRDSRKYDFFHARGYINFGLTRSIDVQAGYDKQFIGQGHRSMVLSDFSSPFLFLKIQSRLGPFQYTNLFGQLTEDIIFSGANPTDGEYPKKFLASHRLGVNITPNLELGVFEMVITDEADLEYFNPIVFYRAIEQQRGSPDNILLGLDFSWNIKKRYQVYGQAIIDEFLIDELRAGDGSWRNKFALQLGGKYLDAFGMSNLDLQAEINLARPFMYSYELPALSFTNYRNPLAHPYGANFKELVLVARYQPTNKLRLTGKVIYTDHGFNDTNNYGGNLLVSTDTRVSDTGNSIGQGVSTQTSYLELTGSYQLLHNLFVDLQAIYRNRSSDDPALDLKGLIPMLSLRWNVPVRQHEF